MGKGKTAAMFSQWDELIVRLDCLLEAKRGELMESNITGLSDAQVMKRISLKETARHCRHRTHAQDGGDRASHRGAPGDLQGCHRQSNLGKDPDVPDGTPTLFEGGGEDDLRELEDDLRELEEEDDLRELEEDDPTMSLPDLDDCLPPVPPLRKATPPPTQPNPSQVPVVTPPDDTAPAASQDPEDDENIGPDGVSGYQHVVLLATSQPLPPLPSLSSTSLPITPVPQTCPRPPLLFPLLLVDPRSPGPPNGGGGRSWSLALKSECTSHMKAISALNVASLKRLSLDTWFCEILCRYLWWPNCGGVAGTHEGPAWC
ncbi:uncharacterized protein LOC109884641 [Oncorhynchus kisutch]|uniref:uncharacterized protein LOC109884641 n=1 Tax=Oncorhynchus kisutch TaxID=8019 RepID=UPI0012DC1F15|nr:uncharacterized protein LOC109884641 [Oncorhynchus kisutch]